MHIVHQRVYVEGGTKGSLVRSLQNDSSPDTTHTDQIAVLSIFFDSDEGGSSPNSFIDSLNLTALATAKNSNGLNLVTSPNVQLNELVNGLSR